jgi:hypothetical protein
VESQKEKRGLLFERSTTIVVVCQFAKFERRSTVGAMGSRVINNADRQTHFQVSKVTRARHKRFGNNRQIAYAIILFSSVFLGNSYGAGEDDFIFLSGNQTITGWKTDTSNWTFSSPASTLLLGGTSIPNLNSTLPGGQLLISTSASNANWPFAVIGGYRNGVSGERYYSGFAPDGHFMTNEYVTLVGIGVGASDAGGSMESIWADIPVALSISNGVANDASGGLLISGWGNFTAQGIWPHVFTVSSQGTTTITNPYGEAYYTRPQLVLGDVGPSSASPDWTYSSLHQYNAHLIIGSFDGNNTEGGELDVSAGQVSVAANFVISPLTPSSAHAAGTKGTIAWDSNYVYICVAPNTWKRAPLSSW